MKISFLIPSTTKGTKFKKLEDTYLFRFLIPSLLGTISTEHKYTLYLALDDDDKLYSKVQTKKKILNKDIYKKFNKNINLDIKVLSTKNIDKGNVVGYWNMLFKKAYEDNNDYFVQCGDDILFHNKGWLDLCIYHLILNMDLGVSAPVDVGNQSLMTQSVVSRKHMEIFGYYYPPELVSWFCDNWITDVYKHSLGVMPRCSLENKGGKPRYTPPDWETTKNLCEKLVEKDKLKLINYINNMCVKD
jgi:hypothetical protein